MRRRLLWAEGGELLSLSPPCLFHCWHKPVSHEAEECWTMLSWQDNMGKAGNERDGGDQGHLSDLDTGDFGSR